MTKEQLIICNYINSLAGLPSSDNDIQFKVEKDRTSDIKLRAVYVNGKFFSYHADLLDMARKSDKV